MVGDGDAVGVASHVVENLLGSGKGGFGIVDLFCLAKRCEISREGRGNLKLLEGGKEMHLAGVEGLLQQLEEQAAE